MGNEQKDIEDIHDEDVFVISNNELFKWINRLYNLRGIHISWNYDDKSKKAEEFRLGFYKRRDRAYQLILLMEERLRERGVKGKYEIDYSKELMKKLDYCNARDVLLRRLKDDSNDWYAHFLIGQCYRMQYDLQSSLEHLETALRLKEYEAKIHLALGHTLRAMEKSEKAIEADKKAYALGLSELRFN